MYYRGIKEINTDYHYLEQFIEIDGETEYIDSARLHAVLNLNDETELP